MFVCRMASIFWNCRSHDYRIEITAPRLQVSIDAYIESTFYIPNEIWLDDYLTIITLLNYVKVDFV